MDAVIAYVDGADPCWQQDYRTAAGQPVLAKRYRDWGTLPFLLRGIEQHLPFVDRVFLVVSRESQVPVWADRAHLQVVLHADIIPAAYLPTFNSTTIELFLHRIPGLSERFLYFNDDMFPVMDASESDFFPDGRPATGFSHHLLARGLYKRQTKNADRMARRALGLRPGPFFLRPQHTCSPMLRSVCEEAFARVSAQLPATLTMLRDARNVNQYLYLDYALLSGRGLARKLSNRHISMAATTPERLAKAIVSPDRKLVCINDVEMSPEHYAALRTAMLTAFSEHFPTKSVYER
ncbi:MAG: hypothetical protein IKX34_00185 [Bacteroidales bacterium]|nr:hypothetical protein [Bacteroidales bacterium]